MADVVVWDGQFWASDRGVLDLSDWPAGAGRVETYYLSGYGFHGTLSDLRPGDVILPADALNGPAATTDVEPGGTFFYDVASPEAMRAALAWGEMKSPLTGGGWSAYLTRAGGSATSDRTASWDARRAGSQLVLGRVGGGGPDVVRRAMPHREWADWFCSTVDRLQAGEAVTGPGPRSPGPGPAESVPAAFRLELSPELRFPIVDLLLAISRSYGDDLAAVVAEALDGPGVRSVTVVECGGTFWACDSQALAARRSTDAILRLALTDVCVLDVTRFGFFGCPSDHLKPDDVVSGAEYFDVSDPDGRALAEERARQACDPHGGTPTVYLVESGRPTPDPAAGVSTRSGQVRVLAKLWNGSTMSPRVDPRSLVTVHFGAD